MNERFELIKRSASAVEGMLSEFSMRVMDCLLSFQREVGVSGNLIEFGVYKGRSAVILASHSSASERLVLVDVANQTDGTTLENICPRLEFIISNSENFEKNFQDFSRLKGSVRFVHIDSGHFFETTVRELALSEQLLKDGGIVVLDDFTNLNFSQILAATYKYLFTRTTVLTMFLVTAEKAYLCKQQDFELFGTFVLTRIAEEMASRGQPCMLARTDACPDYRAFHLAPTSNGSGYYGYQLYAPFYQSA
jgi:hypothetical protein